VSCDRTEALTWLLGGGFIAILVASVYLWVVMTARERTRSAFRQPAQEQSAGLG
jgi:hypothetical protein